MTTNNFIDGLIEKIYDLQNPGWSLEALVKLCVRETAKEIKDKFTECEWAKPKNDDCRECAMICNSDLHYELDSLIEQAGGE